MGFPFFDKKKHLVPATKYVKEQLLIIKDQAIVHISGVFTNSAYEISELWIKARGAKMKLKLEEIDPNPSFTFAIDLRKLIDFLPKNEKRMYDFYLKVTVDQAFLTEKEVEELPKHTKFFKDQAGIEKVKYLMRLGEFRQTKLKNLDFLTYNNQKGLVYITEKGNVSFAYNKEPITEKRNLIYKINSKKNELHIEGKLFTKNSKLLNGTVYLQKRGGRKELEAPISFQYLKEETEANYGLNRYCYKVELKVNQASSGLLDEGTYDVFLNIQMHDHKREKVIRLGRPTYRAKYLAKEAYVGGGQNVSVINPYFTFKRSNLSLEVANFSRSTYLFLRFVTMWAWLFRAFFKRRDVWLIGERTYKAQDTGFHFFRFIREQHPEKRAFYVIKEDSPERRNVEQYGNVLYFNSKKHIWNTLIATKIIGSHHPNYLYPIRTRDFTKKIKALKVFLQHGIMGTKNMVSNYGKNAYGFEADLFLVSSEFEKNIIINDFGYEPDEVCVTGLSRFDRLFENDIPKKRQLLIIPTWRDWIGENQARFLKSEYFARYHELIHHPRLKQLASEWSFQIIFCLHPNMQSHTNHFKDAPVKVINQGEVDVQTLLKESMLMITDYSSVGFDFSFLNKPVLYYQFDKEKFIGSRPSHLNLEQDLPGEIVIQLDDLLNLVEEYTQSNFEMKEEYKRRTERFITYRDQKSNERIYELLQSK